MNEQEEKSVFPPEEPDFEDPNFNWEEWDKLGFKGIAENIVTDIEAFGTPLIYGVYGRWGSGKTSMMRAIQDCFKARNGYKTVWFDPWWYDHAEKEQLFLGLLNKIQRAILPKGSRIKKIGLKIASAGLSGFRVAADVALSWASGKIGASGPSTKDAEEYFKQFQKLLGKNQLEAVDAVEKTRKSLCDAIEGALKEGETLVLFIDDLDRCLPDRAILLLDQLKNFLYLRRVITVLGIDDEVFARMLNKHYRYEGIFGNQYLEKIIRKSYRLGTGVIRELLLTYIPYSSYLREHPYVIDAIVTIWQSVGDINPRIVHRTNTKFIRITENLEFQKRLLFTSNRFPQDIDYSVNWNEFIDDMERKLASSSSEGVMFSRNEGLYVCLWYTIALKSMYRFPLNLENLDSLLTSFHRNKVAPPLWAINLFYEQFREWL